MYNFTAILVSELFRISVCLAVKRHYFHFEDNRGNKSQEILNHFHNLLLKPTDLDAGKQRLKHVYTNVSSGQNQKISS